VLYAGRQARNRSSMAQVGVLLQASLLLVLPLEVL